MKKINEADPIWGQLPCDVWLADDDGRIVNSPRCGGRFHITREALDDFPQLHPSDRAKLTTFILEKNRFGVERYPLITSDTLESINLRRSLTMGAKIQRLLEFLSRIGVDPSSPIRWLGPHTEDEPNIIGKHGALAWTEGVSEADLPGLKRLAVEEGFLTNLDGRTYVSSRGFRAIEEAALGLVQSSQAFVAMWFDPSMQSAYEHGIAKAIHETGYVPLRIDQKEHVNKIDDEIIAEIRRSRFVVADFTCGLVSDGSASFQVPRGGVYYEAGFAQGLGIPVIWSVRADQIGLVHFDTRQFNHITWDTPLELADKLTKRILAIFGDLRLR